MKKTEQNKKRTMKQPDPALNTSQTETQQESNWAKKITQARKAQKTQLASPALESPKLKDCGC